MAVGEKCARFSEVVAADQHDDMMVCLEGNVVFLRWETLDMWSAQFLGYTVSLRWASSNRGSWSEDLLVACRGDEHLRAERLGW